MSRQLWAEQEQQGHEKKKRKLAKKNNWEPNEKQKWDTAHAQPQCGNPLGGADEKWSGLPLNIGATVAARSKRLLHCLSINSLLQLVKTWPVLL